jgi:NADPH:quinone reductase
LKALCFDKFGGPEVLSYRDVPDPGIGPNEILVRTKAIGLNFADVYRRKGNYHLEGEPPYILGYEGAGIVEKVGKGVKTVQYGDRIGFADVPYANAELVAVPEEKAIPLPLNIPFKLATSILLQGLTAHYLTRDSYKVKQDDVVLVHAVAGGVGQLITQICKLMGATVVGLTSTNEKRSAALAVGADYVFLYTEPWVSNVLQLTNEQGVDVVYESVGSTLEESFQALRKRGTLVFFGMSGGDPVLVNPRMLMDTSKTITGGDLWNVLTSREERIQRSNELFEWISGGKINVQPPALYSLKDGAEAHAFLEGRKSTGKILLLP